jgi:hypothetical protein
MLVPDSRMSEWSATGFAYTCQRIHLVDLTGERQWSKKGPQPVS